MNITDKNTIATISDDYPTITSWSVEGRHILFPQQDLIIAGERRKRGGTPLCFPNFGKPVTYNEIGLPQHGFFRDTKDMLYRTQPEDSFVVMAGGVCAYGLEYTINLKMQVHYHRKISTLTQAMYITSGDRKEMMPLCLGFHPYFKVNREYMNFVRDGKEMNMDIFTDQTLLSAQEFDFKNTFEVQLDKNLSVEINCRGDFETGQQKIYIWSDRPDEYICIEPVMHDCLSFGTDKGYFVGNKTKCFHVSYACKTY
jgi:galactose mutarotase-like enzyme